MPLDLKRLLQFNLVADAERMLAGQERTGDVRQFFVITEEIRGIDQFIKDTPSQPGSTDTIVRDELVRAVAATLSIEGVALNSAEIEESFDRADRNEHLRRSELEVQNSRRAYEFMRDLVRDHASDFLYSERIIKQIHSFFTQGMNYPSNTPGEYRDSTRSFGVPRRDGLCRTRC